MAAFGEWARASRGSFRPTEVEESWRGPEGPVDISFTLAGRRRRVTAQGLGDFLDVCVLIRDVNRLIGRSGRRFELYRPDAALGQVAFAAALSASERRALERRGWRFAPASEAGRTFAYGRLYEGGDASGCR